MKVVHRGVEDEGRRKEPARDSRRGETGVTLLASYEMPDPVPLGEREITALNHLNDWMVAQKILPGPIAIDRHIWKTPTQ